MRKMRSLDKDEIEQICRIYEILRDTYTIDGCVTWFTSPNRHLSMFTPLHALELGFSYEVMEVARRIESST